jgi:hypothetical protein
VLGSDVSDFNIYPSNDVSNGKIFPLWLVNFVLFNISVILSSNLKFDKKVSKVWSIIDLSSIKITYS